MLDKALGLIETVGLIGAIEAADAAAKAAEVIVSSAELTEATFITLKIEGELGAVQAAVEAGARAAEKIGELLSVHVIPNPDKELLKILPARRYVTSYRPDDNRPALELESEPEVLKKKPDTSPTKEKDGLTKRLNDMTVSELRQIARSLKDFPLKGREISMANKQQLIDVINKFNDKDR